MTITHKENLRSLAKEIDVAIDTAADMIRDVLEAYADHIEATEPYATRTIADLRAASQSISNLAEELGEELAEEPEEAWTQTHAAILAE